MSMMVAGEEHIAATVGDVWEGLNEPELLKACIPGCETMSKESETNFTAIVAFRLGPIKARFHGVVELSNLKPPHSYTISIEGKGGLAGFAKGSADVTLSPADADSTILAYQAQAEVGGKLAQLGSRIIRSRSKKIAEKFFADFNARINGTNASEIA